MSRLHPFGSNWPDRSRFLVNVSVAAALAFGCSVQSRATGGFYGTSEYIAAGGANVDASPEFYWEVEVKRLAGAFHPVEKRVVPVGAPSVRREPAEGIAPKDESRAALTEKADESDFAAALREGRIKPPDPARATLQHEAARKLVSAAGAETAGELPEEFASEFAAYHRGALAYRLGGEHWKEARRIWEDLLQRPEAERHYRSVWAAFMIGKAALKLGDPEAATWFQRTRELAKAGFADSLGMAADSYGWEARSEWKQGHPQKAPPLYLTQLALGDESAVVSLKALIPDRDDVAGWLNYDSKTDEETGLAAAARDPWLRRLVTAHILALASIKGVFADEGRTAEERGGRWLAVIKDAKFQQKHAALPIALKVSKEERQRLEKNKIVPEIRYHYRIVAAALAMRAAKLLPDNAEELAEVVNTAGLWVKDRDEKTGDRYYQVLEKRSAQTKIGRSAIEKHCFVDATGPWSEVQQKAYEAMHQALDPKKPEQ